MPINNSISIYNDSQQNVAQNAAVVFNKAKFQNGSQNNNNANAVTINLPGTYLVTFTASGAGSTAQTTPVFQLQDGNGNNIPGAKASVQTSANTDIASIAFTTIVDVVPTCPFNANSISLQVVNVGAEALLQNAALTVVKVG